MDKARPDRPDRTGEHSVKPLLVMISTSKHPWFPEGEMFDFESFEHKARTAAQYYIPKEDIFPAEIVHDEFINNCMEISVFFDSNDTIDCHIHAYVGGGDFGFYDVLGNLLMDGMESPEVQKELSMIHRVIH
jgi:hypothetical protein|tara:strand:+ start:586 stop:981 length:396 start_codon:yes stop_codon:yes gene_type:complete